MSRPIAATGRRWIGRHGRWPGRRPSGPVRRCVAARPRRRWGWRPNITPPLWEQDFGAWEEPGATIPDLGPLPPEALAAARPPGGESFLDMAARVQPVLEGARGTTAVIAHAGTVRAALALAIGPAALSFAVAPLSLTILARTPAGWAVEAVNRVAP